MAGRYYRVDIQFRNGASESFDAREFDIDVSDIGLGTEAERQRTTSSGSRTRGDPVRRYLYTSSPPRWPG